MVKLDDNSRFFRNNLVVILHESPRLIALFLHAWTGDCVVSRETWELLATEYNEGQVLEHGCVRITAAPEVKELLETEPEETTTLQALSRLAVHAEKFVPHLVREKVKAGLFDFMGEHRVVGSDFVVDVECECKNRCLWDLCDFSMRWIWDPKADWRCSTY